MSKMRLAPAVALLSIICVFCTSQAFAGQWIVGSVSIRNHADQNVYGEYLAVFLVSQKNPASAKKCLGESDPQRRLDCINNSHLDFYKRFQAKQHDTGYLIAQTVTSETGNFAFFDVPVGKYYVLVKFPSMIDGYKVAWQAPVTMTPNRTAVVNLDEDNLVLPKNRRR